MPGLVRQTEPAGPPMHNSQDPNSFASRIREHWARKQETTTKLPASPAYSSMVEYLQGTSSDPLEVEQRLTRNIERGLQGDAATFSIGRTLERKGPAKKKSQYYDDAFAIRESNTSAKERVQRESMVMMEVRTNVIVSDEYTFITDLSYNLSSRYQRPESSILVTLTHSVCLLLGGSFDPAYTMTITALPSQVQPVTNKRNTMLLAKLLEESLGVPPSRGLIRFVGVEEENFAFNGKTAAAEIEDLEKEDADDSINIKRTLSRLGPKSATKKQSKRSIRSLKVNTAGVNSIRNATEPSSPNAVASGSLTPPNFEREPLPQTSVTALPLPDRLDTTTTISMPPLPVNDALDRKAEKFQKMGHRKSFISGLFGRQGGWERRPSPQGT